MISDAAGVNCRTAEIERQAAAKKKKKPILTCSGASEIRAAAGCAHADRDVRGRMSHANMDESWTRLNDVVILEQRGGIDTRHHCIFQEKTELQRESSGELVCNFESSCVFSSQIS